VATTPERLAAIDVGSNSIRLVIAEWDPGSGITIIDDVKEQPRLAAGVAQRGALGAAEMTQALTSLRLMLDICQRREVTRIRAVATAAVREAANGPAFLQEVKDALGLDLEIIDGATEASLSYRSVAHHFKVADTKTLVADIGGGSLEVIGAVDGLIELTDSLPFGAVRLTDLYLLGDRPAHKALKALRLDVRKALRKTLSKRGWIGATIIGSGGTFTNLGRMVAARRGISLDEPVHGLFISTADVEHLLERLAAMPPDVRARVPGLNPSRADIIVAGVAVTAELLKRVNGRGVTVSAFGLREGLLLDMAGADPVPASDDPMRLVREFAERCHVDRSHGEQVRRLCLTLFEALAEPLAADPNEVGLLEAAALLHDVGQLVNYKNHQKHSYQLIVHAERLNLPAEDRLLVAHVCRYHRKAGPSKRHHEFAALEPSAQRVVRRLCGILRIADGLDRGGTATVDHIVVRLTPECLQIEVAPRDAGTDLSLECWAAGRKSDVLAKLLAREVRIVQVS
jgi:exopolyphosphatase/guanosine-5'-triphosphate,3'-diphosphate pyrophosphatase